MKIRIGVGAATTFENVDDFWRWVGICEESEIDSIWCSDRVISPQPTLEPITTIAALVGVTKRLKFGFNALSVPFRNPVVLAKQCANLDYLSGGRLLPVFGIGQGGRTPNTMRPSGRGARMNEALEIMTRLWTGESVTFEGKYYQVEAATIRPLPPQQPMPIWIGGVSPAALRRTARYGTGWIGGLNGPEQASEAIAGIKREASAIGREIDEEHFGATFLFRIEPDGAKPEDLESRIGPIARAVQTNLAPLSCVGSAETVFEKLREFRKGGASKFVAIPLANGDADFIEQTRLLAAEVIPDAHQMT